MNYKMIVLDLDGTLTNRDKVITDKTRQALMEAQKRGKKVVLASGRPTYGVVPLAEELELGKYGGCILSFNGLPDRRGAFSKKASGRGEPENYWSGSGGKGKQYSDLPGRPDYYRQRRMSLRED